MGEHEIVAIIIPMDVFDKLSVYMNYWIERKWVGLPVLSFEEFFPTICWQFHYIGDSWRERGFASESWYSLHAGKAAHYIFHNQENYHL